MQIQSLSNQYFFENQDNLFYQTSTDSKQEGLESGNKIRSGFTQRIFQRCRTSQAVSKQVKLRVKRKLSFTRDPSGKKVNG